VKCVGRGEDNKICVDMILILSFHFWSEQEQSGQHFDPQVLEAFLDLLAEQEE
jgi:hypothetical protein